MTPALEALQAAALQVAAQAPDLDWTAFSSALRAADLAFQQARSAGTSWRRETESMAGQHQADLDRVRAEHGRALAEAKKDHGVILERARSAEALATKLRGDVARLGAELEGARQAPKDAAREALAGAIARTLVRMMEAEEEEEE